MPHTAAASQQIRPRCARLLAKPEYSSPPDEVCCWPGAMAELLLARGTVAELHREAFAGQGHRGGEPSGSFCWRGAAAKGLNGREHCGRDLSGRSCWPERREVRKWSLPQPVARVLLCGALPELKVKNLLLQCTYNGAGRDFLSHFNRNPA